MDASFIAEHNDISRMCLKLGHNFLKIQKDITPYKKKRDEEKLEEYENYENDGNQNLKKTNRKQLNCDNNILHNIEGETLKLFDDNTQQTECELFQELNQQFLNDSFKKTQKYPNEDENIQVFLEVQVQPEFQDNNTKEQIMPERDLKLDLKIVFESEEEENTQLQLDKEKKNVEKQTEVKYCSKNRLQEIESEPINKKRKLTKEQHHKNIEDVDRLKINESNIKTNDDNEQKSKEEVEIKSIEPNEMLKKKIEKKLKKSNVINEKMVQGKFDSSVIQQANEKFLNNFAVSFEKVIKPIEVKINDICGTYFPIECKLRQTFNNDVQTNTPIHKDVNNLTVSDKNHVVSQFVDNKTKYSLNGDENTMFENDKRSEFSNEKSINNKSELLLNFDEKANKIVLDETKTHGAIKKKKEKFKEIVETEESFDLVILYNSDQKNIEEKTLHDVNVLQINYNEEILAKFEENSLKNLDNKIQEVGERVNSEIEKQKQKFLWKQRKEDLCLQFCFFREEENISSVPSVGSSISTIEETSNELLKHNLYNEEQVKFNESCCVQEFSQKYSDDSNVDIETLSDTVDDTERKILNEYKVIKETPEEEIPVYPVDISIDTIEENSNKLLEPELDDEEEIKVSENSFPQGLLEDSDVDIETFSDTVEDVEKPIQYDAEVCLEMFEEETTLSSNTSFDEEDYCNSFRNCVEINEVIEVVEEYEVVNGLKSDVDYQSPTVVKSSSIKQKNHEEIDKNSNEQDEYGKSLLTLETTNQNEVENSNKRLKNVQQLDEILREKMRKELHSQLNGSYALNENMKLESNKEQELTNDRQSSCYQVLNKQRETLLELKNGFQNTQQEFNNIDKLSKKLLQKHNEKKVKIDLPKKFHELKLVDKNLSNELEELSKEVNEFEPELQRSVQFKDSNINHIISKEEPYDIFKKLRSIHDKQLIKFSESNEWPENCLYPSSTLDLLFEDPDEVKPNVLLFTLFPEDIGYSIKLVMQINQPPVELFYTYFDDSVLPFVEKGKLPIELLDLLDRAELRLFYSGCVVAEIHDHRYGELGRIYRILLRPWNESIRYDINKIIEENSHIHWTYFKKLELERRMLILSNPVICGDSLPIAGTAALMQHHFTSCRSICLNPLKNDFIMKSNSLNPDSLNEFETSDSMDFMCDKNSILQEFGFHLKLSKIDILTLIILGNTDPFKVSLLLCSSTKVKPTTVMKVEALFDAEKTNDLMTVTLDILRQKISNDIEVIQRDKYDENLFHILKFSPILPDDYIYEITHADISKLIDKFIANVCINYLTVKNYLENVHESEIDPLNVKLVVNPETLSTNTQNNGETYLNLQTDDKNKKRIHFCSTKKMSKNSSKYLDLTNMKLGRDQIVESLPLKSETILPLSVILNVESLSENSSENNESKSDVDLSFTRLFLSKDSNINLEQEYTYELLPIPNLTYVMSSLPCYLTLVSSTTSTMSSYDKNPFYDNDIPNNSISFETSIIDPSIPNNLQFQTIGQTLTRINDNSTDTRLESVIVTSTEHTEHSINIGDPTSYVLEDLPTTSYDNLETEFSQINEETIKQISNLRLN